ncbi:transglutaminase family protein [Nitrogeniibacter mangrovi]|uniref:Transglutaminase family protein n=1 Tax=Nitrogeniibacter mangrovi TaxID=2016596 RepID=A0A6C1B719_9RHOO|nr:transglutaminase family protein [Nitrogeniibacter mangrovi]QID18090.1 transglutaminase family protein [Nitrogeniibacter mangrovi]
MARYHILHETNYDYGGAVSLSHQVLHLVPRPSDWQTCLRYELSIDPEPSWRRAGQDAFGNSVEWLGFYQPHPALNVRAEMEVEVRPRGAIDLAESLPWDELARRLIYQGGVAPRADDLAAKRFLFESPNVRVKNELRAYALDCFPPGRALLEGAAALMAKIFDEFTFDAEATSIATPVLEVLANKRGVCQDFAHLMIACLRALGLPARYMSGYLLTHPPPGQPRMIGADASHAWVSVYAPDTALGWVEFDPTNNLQPDTQHITIGWGRDFNDVSPLRGIILGGGGHEPEVAVTVTPLDER